MFSRLSILEGVYYTDGHRKSPDLIIDEGWGGSEGEQCNNLLCALRPQTLGPGGIRERQKGEPGMGLALWDLSPGGEKR